MSDSKISALTAATSLTGTDEFVINAGGTSKKVTHTVLSDSISTSFVGIAGNVSMGTTTADAGTFTIIKGAQAGDPQAQFALSGDTAGDLSITVNTGDLILDAKDDIFLKADGDTRLGLTSTALYSSTNGGINLGIAGTNEFANTYLASGGKIDWNNGVATLTHTSNGGIDFLTLTSTQAYFTIGDNQGMAMQIQQGSNSYVGISTSDGSEQLYLGNGVTNPDIVFNGSGDFRPSSDGAMLLGTSGTAWSALHLTGTGSIYWGGTSTHLTATSTSVGLTISNIEAARFTGSGQVQAANGVTPITNNTGSIGSSELRFNGAFLTTTSSLGWGGNSAITETSGGLIISPLGGGGIVTVQGDLDPSSSSKVIGLNTLWSNVKSTTLTATTGDVTTVNATTVNLGTATVNAGVLSLIQGEVASDPTFAITQSGDDVTISQTVGDITIDPALNLYLNPDATGDIDCFATTDVDNAADGKVLYVRRKAAEGDDAIKIYVNAAKANVLTCDNGSLLFRGVTGAEVYAATSGDLKLQGNAKGDVVCFSDTDVTDTSDGKSFYVHRKAAEGNGYIQAYVDATGFGQIKFSGYNATRDLTIRNITNGLISIGDDATSLIHFNRYANNDCYFFNVSGSGDNRSIRQSGYITANTASKYINWQLNDTTDNFELTREDAFVLGFDIQMPLITDDITSSGKLVNTPDEITATSEGVAASVATVNTEVTTNGDQDLDNVTLANGTSGQEKSIYCTVKGHSSDTWKITPTTMLGGTIITFTGAAGQGCILKYADSEGWVVVGNNGGTIS